jgi:hypothetical protein
LNSITKNPIKSGSNIIATSTPTSTHDYYSGFHCWGPELTPNPIHSGPPSANFGILALGIFNKKLPQCCVVPRFSNKNTTWHLNIHPLLN